MSTPEAIRLADESAALASSPYLKPIDMSVTIAQALRANAAELRRMAALNAELLSELAAMHRNYRHHVDTISNWAIAMQAAVIAAGRDGDADGMEWIENILEGPGLLPPAVSYRGTAQEWFDAKTAEHEAWCAEHPVKYQAALIAKAEGGAA